MKKGDKVTIDGVIIGSHYNEHLHIKFIHIRLKSGIEFVVTEKDIKRRADNGNNNKTDST